MKEFKSILFPVDLSETSSKMVPYVSVAAKRLKADIHMLFVVREFSYYSEMYVSDQSINSFHTSVIEGAETRMDEFRKKHFKEFNDVQCSVVLGDISDEILKYAENENNDLLVLGTHGRKGLEKIFFGSIADRLIKTSSLPVFLVNPYNVKTFNLESPQSDLKILFPVDLSDISPEIVPYVKSLANGFQAEITLLCVVRPSGYFVAVYQADHTIQSFEQAVIADTESKLEAFKNEHFKDFPKTKFKVEYGDIPDRILNRIKTEDFDLLVLGTHGRKGLDKILFGSVAERVSKLASVPLLLVNPYRLNA